jgi:hypothetical protein
MEKEESRIFEIYQLESFDCLAIYQRPPSAALDVMATILAIPLLRRGLQTFELRQNKS